MATKDSWAGDGKTTPEFQQILDTFSGADGGASFVAVRNLYNAMRDRAEHNDAAAKELVAIVHRFARFIQTAEKLQNTWLEPS